MATVKRFGWGLGSIVIALLIGGYVQFIAAGPINLQWLQVGILFVGCVANVQALRLPEQRKLFSGPQLLCFAGLVISVVVVLRTP